MEAMGQDGPRQAPTTPATQLQNISKGSTTKRKTDVFNLTFSITPTIEENGDFSNISQSIQDESRGVMEHGTGIAKDTESGIELNTTDHYFPDATDKANFNELMESLTGGISSNHSGTNISFDDEDAVFDEGHNHHTMSHTGHNHHTMSHTSSVDYVGYVMVPFLLLIGIPGNTFTIIIMLGRKFCKMSSSVLLIALSCSDTTLILLLPFTKTFTKDILGVDVTSLSEGSCKVFYFLFKTAKMTSSWFVVLLTFERWLAVWFPFKVRSIHGRKQAYMMVIANYICISAYNLVWSVFSDTLHDGVCRAHLPNLPEYKQLTEYFVFGATMILSFIPTVLLLIMSPMIIYKITVHRRKRQTLTQRRSVKQRQATKDKVIKSAAMVLSVAIAFIVLVNPIAIAHIVTKLINVDFFRSTDPLLTVMREITQTCEQLNYSINFFLFVIWNDNFRAKFIRLWKCSPNINDKSSPNEMIYASRESFSNSTNLDIQPSTVL